MSRLQIISESPERTQALGELLGRLSKPGDLYLLTGGLGAGKTHFVQGLARGLGVSEPTRSPSFTLINEYRGFLPLYHADLYRIENVEDPAMLGLDDYIYFGEGVTAVEWADKAAGAWPADNMTLIMTYVSDQEREITFEAHGPRYEAIIADLQNLPQSEGA